MPVTRTTLEMKVGDVVRRKAWKEDDGWPSTYFRIESFQDGELGKGEYVRLLPLAPQTEMAAAVRQMSTSKRRVEKVAGYWDFCGMCGPMVVCGKCGNNCCNGGYGRADGSGPHNGDDSPACSECPAAYEMEKSDAPPRFTEAYMARRRIPIPENYPEL